jgi:hypothetical protein
LTFNNFSLLPAALVIERDPTPLLGAVMPVFINLEIDELTVARRSSEISIVFVSIYTLTPNLTELDLELF